MLGATDSYLERPRGRLARLMLVALFVALIATIGSRSFVQIVLASAPPLARAIQNTPVLEAPQDEARHLALVTAGTEVMLTGSAEIDYVAVEVNGQAGWIAAADLAVSNRPGISLAAAVHDARMLDAPADDGGVLGVVPSGDVVILTGANVGGFVAGSYEGVGGWIAEADIGMPYDNDGNGW